MREAGAARPARLIQAAALAAAAFLVALGQPAGHPDAATSTVTITAVVPGPDTGGGSGGGGGSGSGSDSRTVTFSGIASPRATVSLLKDGVRFAQVTAGDDARFRTTLPTLAAGTYLFSAYAIAEDGGRTPVLGFPVTVARNATMVVGGIVLGPTAAANLTEVRRGDLIQVSGRTAPFARVGVLVDLAAQASVEVASDGDGAYRASIGTAALPFGEHLAHAKAVIGDILAPESPRVQFTVGTRNVAAPSSAVPPRVDQNGDAKVDMVDFSILAYWYRRPGAPAGADLNGDGIVDLTDFSILMYYWTG